MQEISHRSLIALGAAEFQRGDRQAAPPPAASGQSPSGVMYATVLWGRGSRSVIFIWPIKASVSLKM